jgi:hypothetical protein
MGGGAVTPGEAVVKAVEILYQADQRPLTIVETGCIRGETENYRVNDGYSTLRLAEWVKEHEGSALHSVDFVIDVAEKVCAGLPVQLHRARGADWLRQHDGKIDFAYLDSSNDPVNNLEEFIEVHKRDARMVMIDDVYCWESVNKGALTVPVAQLLGYKLKAVGGRLALLARPELDDRALAAMDYVTMDAII